MRYYRIFLAEQWILSHLTSTPHTSIIKPMAKKFITNWWTLLECFFLSYVLSSAIAIIVLLLTGSEFAHWIVKLLISPVFVFLFTLKYYSKDHTKREARRITLIWTPLFIIFDLITYVVVAGYSVTWYFWQYQPWVAIYFMLLFIAPLFIDQIQNR